MRRNIGLLLDPFLILMLGMGAAVFWIWLKRRLAPRPVTCVVVIYGLLYLSCLPLISHVALGSLEWRFDVAEAPQERQAIVVLGGSLIRNDDPSLVRLGEDSKLRCQRAIETYRNGEPCPILLSGGNMGLPTSQRPSLATLMAEYIRQQGLAPVEVILEQTSSDTHSNAVESAQLLQSRDMDTIVLVTDATHMLRAQRCFQAQGIEVIPVCVQPRTQMFKLSIWSFLPSPDAARDLNCVAHEWIGIAWYSFNGFI